MKADKHYKFSRKLYNTIEYFHLYPGVVILSSCCNMIFMTAGSIGKSLPVTRNSFYKAYGVQRLTVALHRQLLTRLE